MLTKLPRSLAVRVHREESQSIVTLALMSLFILAILAVVVESSAVYIQRRNLQNAADAAALAGAQELNGLPAGEAPAIAAAQAYADDNVSDLLGVTAVVSEGYTQVQVHVQKKAATAFAGWLSFGEPVVTAKATARIASFNIIRCVVPIAVQDTAYFEGTTSGEDPPPLVELKSGLHEGDAGSNTGLVNLGPGNSAEPIRTGGGCGLEPMIPTKPGLTGGDVRNGFQDRLEAAMANDCYTWDEAKPPSDDSIWRCKPERAVVEGIEATAVVLLPVLHVDIDNSGSGSYPIAQLDNGQYLLAFFWVDGEGTWDTSKGTWQCWDNPNCIIRGRFIVDEPVDLEVFEPTKCPPGEADCVLDWDPAATTKIIQLID